MRSWTITCAGLEEHRSDAEALRLRLIEGWSGPGTLDITLTSIEELDATNVADIDALVIHAAGAPDLRPLRALITEVEEQGRAVLTVLPDESLANASRLAGAMHLPDQIDDRVLAAALQGLLHRQAEVSRLRHEVAIAQRFHGGLRGEIEAIHDELQLAAMMQREYLPRDVPCVHGVEFAVLWRPAHYVSGDIYSVHPLDENRVGIFVADCVGHGVPAALMTMIVARSLTPTAQDGDMTRTLEPAEVLERLNRDLVRRQAETTRFATAVYAIVDCASRRLSLAGAGHPHPMLANTDGAVTELETSGSLLGIFEEGEFDQIEIDLAEDDRLMIYSDGFEQAFPEKGATDRKACRLPTHRYRDELHALTSSPTAHAMIDHMSQRLDDQAGSLHQADDLTLLCLRAGDRTAA